MKTDLARPECKPTFYTLLTHRDAGALRLSMNECETNWKKPGLRLEVSTSLDWCEPFYNP